MENKEKYREVLDEQFECICEECSKPFVGIDENATLCPKCWEKVIIEAFKDNGIPINEIGVKLDV